MTGQLYNLATPLETMFRKNIMQGIVAVKRSRGKPRQIWEEFGAMATQQRVEWRRTGINFAKTFGVRRPEEDMLSKEYTAIKLRSHERFLSGVL